MNTTRLGDITGIITSGSRGWASYYSDDGALFLRMTNLPKNGIKLLLDDNKFVKLPEETSEAERTAVQDGDILISITAELGKIGFVENIPQDEAYVNQHVCLARPLPQKVNPKFLAYYLSSQTQRNLLNRLNDAGAKSGLNLQTISKFPIRIPDRRMQDFIVEALEQWDAAIEKIEALIDAKGRRFEWLLNSLICIPTTDWDSCTLKEISKIRKGQQLNRDTFEDSGEYPVWNGGVSPSGFTTKYNTLANTITISEGGSCGFVNYCNENFWLGGHCYALEKINPRISSKFLFFFLKTHEHRIMSLKVGSGIPNIQKRDVERFVIHYPRHTEQKRIAEILNTARHEIELLRKLAEQYSKQRRSLMQKIFTVRLGTMR